jgi:hypothetical protein
MDLFKYVAVFFASGVWDWAPGQDDGASGMEDV